MSFSTCRRTFPANLNRIFLSLIEKSAVWIVNYQHICIGKDQNSRMNFPRSGRKARRAGFYTISKPESGSFFSHFKPILYQIPYQHQFYKLKLAYNLLISRPFAMKSLTFNPNMLTFSPILAYFRLKLGLFHLLIHIF